MNIVIVCPYLPFPTNQGQKVDIYNRILALNQLGHKIFMITWGKEDLSSPIFDDFQSNVEIEEFFYIKRNSDFFKLSIDILKKGVKGLYQSTYVTQLSANDKTKKDLISKLLKFKPDLYLLESVYVFKFIDKLKEKYKAPVYIRSHNVEHRYIQSQRKVATDFLTWLKLFGISRNLEAYENDSLKKADGFLDLSNFDMSYWRNKGFKNAIYLPPVFPKWESINYSEDEKFEYDITYIGNLYMSNNLEAIFWFINTAVPEIQKSIPDVKVLIAGSNPTSAVINLISQNQSVTLIKNPDDIKGIYKKSNVIINPIKVVSGVNIKSIEMVYYANQVVCTPQAIQGLPIEFNDLFTVVERNQNFAKEIVNLLSRTSKRDFELRKEIQYFFSKEYFNNVLNDLKNKAYGN